MRGWRWRSAVTRNYRGRLEMRLRSGGWCQSQRVRTVPGKENLTHFPLEATKAILHYYNTYYGIKYPLPKLDNIAVPDFQAGAMENWGRHSFTARRRCSLTTRPHRSAPNRKLPRPSLTRLHTSGSAIGHRGVVGRHLAQRRLCHVDDTAPSNHGNRSGCCPRAWLGALIGP